jgi:Ala-tRNA(Pro) deacylase
MTILDAIGWTADDTYAALITMLNDAGARYRLIDHRPEGQTEAVSMIRGHRLSQAAKCMVLRVRLSKKSRRYILAVVPGDRRVDLNRVGDLFGGKSASFATRDVAEHLAGTVSGSILPFSFHPELQVMIDRKLLEHDEIYFNAARLDRSVALATQDYLSLAGGSIESIAEADHPC